MGEHWPFIERLNKQHEAHTSAVLTAQNRKGDRIRTAPLWGLRFLTTYLHDGRARTLDQAIGLHDGEARASRDRYNALNRGEKDKVLAFLRSL